MSETDEGGVLGRKRGRSNLSKTSLDGTFAEEDEKDMSDEDDMEEAGGMDE